MRVERAIARCRANRAAVGPSLHALAIVDAEVDEIVAGGEAETGGADEVVAQYDRITARTRATSAPAAMPLAVLAERFALDRIELELCVLCLIPDLFPRYGRVYAYLHDDVTRTRASIALALDVLGESWAERLALRAALHDRAPLVRKGVVRILPDGEVALEPIVVDHLLARLPTGSTEKQDIDDVLLAPETRARAEQLIDRARDGRGTGELIVLVGAAGSGRQTLARAIGASLGLSLHAHSVDPPDVSALDRWMRDVRLRGGAPIVELAACSERDLERTLLAVAELCATWQFRIAFVTAESLPPDSARTAGVTVVELPRLGGTIRAEAWKRALAAEQVSCDDAQLHAVASLFPFTIGQIQSTAREAVYALRARDATASVLDAATWRRACRQRAHHQLDRMAERIATPHEWDDLVLPRDHVAQLREIADAVERRAQVLEEWQFGEKICTSPGVAALFSGPSGTGKTMAAGVLARQLGMELYRIDLSRIVSKYIGETEKNLEQLFAEARRAYAVLFFDEADALFGKRAEVKDAHDRYANIEVAYLLQRMESYEGLTVLATNLRNNIDEAFLRRLQFCVEFPQPTIADRQALWRKVWPAAAPRAADLDLEFVAHHLELTGGQIRNIALKAAYLAAAESADIGMRHLVAAIRREHQKLGRLTVERTFGPYASLFADLERT